MNNNRYFHIWKNPLLLSFVTVFGLMAALLGVGVWHLFSWAALVIPLATLTGFIFRAR